MNPGETPTFPLPRRGGYNLRMSQTIFMVLGVAVAALVVWLTVRIVNWRERWAKRTALALAMLLAGYPLSFGPACWMTSRFGSLYPAFGVTYRPLVWAADHTPGSWQKFLLPYALFGMPKNGQLLIRHSERLAIYRS
jgi:hypothetical protein